MSTQGTELESDAQRYQFGDFVLDVRDRQLWRGSTRIDVNARYLDALVLLVRERNHLVNKDRFFDDVWTGVVVSDSALAQCIKHLRKLLGDDASSPRYIQTVPGHGYRFIGAAELLEADRTGSAFTPQDASLLDTGPQTAAARTAQDPFGVRKSRGLGRHSLYEWGAATLGGASAGLFGGMLYGFGLASSDAQVGTLSTLLVLVSLNVLVGLTGGFGIGAGLAGADAVGRFMPKKRILLRIVGAALGGLFVGSLAKMLGVDAFNLLFGRAPAGITGGKEGAFLGAALALGAYLGHYLGDRSGEAKRWYAAAGAGVAGGVAGALIPAAGGHLMGGSLELLATSFAESRLQLDTFGPLFGELNFGLATQIALGGIEGLLFGGCVVGALSLIVGFENEKEDVWRL